MGVCMSYSLYRKLFFKAFWTRTSTRAYYYPRWLLSITFPLSFGLMAVEFSRFVFGSELMHSGEAGIHE